MKGFLRGISVTFGAISIFMLLLFGIPLQDMKGDPDRIQMAFPNDTLEQAMSYYRIYQIVSLVCIAILILSVLLFIVSFFFSGESDGSHIPGTIITLFIMFSIIFLTVLVVLPEGVADNLAEGGRDYWYLLMIPFFGAITIIALFVDFGFGDGFGDGNFNFFNKPLCNLGGVLGLVGLLWFGDRSTTALVIFVVALSLWFIQIVIDCFKVPLSASVFCNCVIFCLSLVFIGPILFLVGAARSLPTLLSGTYKAARLPSQTSGTIPTTNGVAKGSIVEEGLHTHFVDESGRKHTVTGHSKVNKTFKDSSGKTYKKK